MSNRIIRVIISIYQFLPVIVAGIVGSIFTYYFLTPPNIMPGEKFDIFVQALIILLGIMAAVGFVIYRLILIELRRRIQREYREYFSETMSHILHNMSVTFWNYSKWWKNLEIYLYIL